MCHNRNRKKTKAINCKLTISLYDFNTSTLQVSGIQAYSQSNEFEIVIICKCSAIIFIPISQYKLSFSTSQQLIGLEIGCKDVRRLFCAYNEFGSLSSTIRKEICINIIICFHVKCDIRIKSLELMK